MGRKTTPHLILSGTTSPVPVVDFLIEREATVRPARSEVEVRGDQAHEGEDAEDGSSGRCRVLCGRIGGITIQLIHTDADRLDQGVDQPGTDQHITPGLAQPEPRSGDRRHREPECEVLHPTRVRGQAEALKGGTRLGSTDRREDPPQPNQGVEAHNRP